MKKIIIIPVSLDLSEGSDTWKFLRTDAFAKLRNVCPETLSETEIKYLREWFSQFIMLTDEEIVLHFVEEDDPLSISMMTAAAFELSALMLNRQKNKA